MDRVAYLKCAPCEEVGSWVPRRGLGFLRACYEVHGFLWQALQLPCNRVVRSCSDSAEVGRTLLTSVTELVDRAASLRSGDFNLLCFKVSAPGISLFNLQLRAISEEIPEEVEKKKNTTTWTDQNNQMDCVVEMGCDWQLMHGSGQPAVALSQQGLLCWGIGSKYCWD